MKIIGGILIVIGVFLAGIFFELRRTNEILVAQSTSSTQAESLQYQSLIKSNLQLEETITNLRKDLSNFSEKFNRQR